MGNIFFLSGLMISIFSTPLTFNNFITLSIKLAIIDTNLLNAILSKKFMIRLLLTDNLQNRNLVVFEEGIHPHY